MVVKVSKPEINVREKISELDKPSGVAGQAMLAAETPQEQFNLIGAGRRRMNINGAMNVFQRGNVTGISTHDYGGADRYLMHNNVAGTIALTEDADVPEGGGFQSSYKIACTATETFAAASNLFLLHRLEGQDSQCTNFGKPNASSLTLSFWIKSNRAGEFNVNFENELPTDGGSDRGYQTKQTLNQADTWEYKVVTIEGDNVSGKSFTNNTLKGLCFEISLSKGGSAWAATASKPYWHDLANAERTYHNEHFFGDSTDNYWKITGVQLELGKVATPFEHRSFGEELALCQRYFQRLKFAGGHTKVALAYNTTSGLCTIDYSTKREIPTIVTLPTATTSTNQANGISLLTSGGSYRSATGSEAVAASHISEDTCRINLTNFTASGSTGDATWAYFTSTSNQCHIDVQSEI